VEGGEHRATASHALPVAVSTLGRLRDLPPESVLDIVKSLVKVPARLLRLADAAEGTKVAPACVDSNGNSAGIHAAHEAAQRLFDEATDLADRPNGGWLGALPPDKLHEIARACAFGRNPLCRMLSVNHSRRLMAATERALRAHVEQDGVRIAMPATSLVPLCRSTTIVLRHGALSETTAHSLFGLIARIATDGGASAQYPTADLCSLLHSYTRALEKLGGGPDPRALLDIDLPDALAPPRPASASTLRDRKRAADARDSGKLCRALVLALHGELATRAPSLTPAQLAGVMWSLGTNGLPAQPLLRALARALPAAVPSLSPGEKVSSLWGLCARGFFPRDAVTALVGGLNAHARALAAGEGGRAGRKVASAEATLSPSHRILLRAADLALRLEGPWALRPTPLLDKALLGPALVGAGDGGWSAGLPSGGSSALHMQISARLDEMGTAHVNEARIESLGCVVDVLVADSPVVLEILGMRHYAYGGVELTNSTALKLRLLRLEGWLVVELPYFEWNALGNSAQAQREYLASKIVGYVPLWMDV
jgi:hypothetical protein